MEGKKLYEKYKGRIINGLKICGYDDEGDLIGAVMPNDKDDKGWHDVREYEHIITNKNNPLGYDFVLRNSLNKPIISVKICRR